MKTIKYSLQVLSVLILMLQGCNQKPVKKDVEADKQAIRELLGKYCDACKEGDLELFLSAWEDEAIRLEDNFHPVRGKEELREHFKVPFDMFDVEVTIYGDVQIDVYGDVANGIGNYILATTFKGTDSTLYFDGKFLDIYRRQPDGSWLFYVDCVTSNPQVTKETMKPDAAGEEDLTDPKF
jgi:ketosteroid isomerase-like protein